jgi:hypothetical protein
MRKRIPGLKLAFSWLPGVLNGTRRIHRLVCLLAGVCLNLLFPLESKANWMGNLPGAGNGHSIATEAGNTFGTAAEFTPLQNIQFNSVTLWLSGYTGLDGSVLYLSVLNNYSGTPFPQPGGTIAIGSAKPNDGSDGAVTFDLSGNLQASTQYWLFLYLWVPGGGFGPDYGLFNCYWDGGGKATDNVLVNGSEEYINGFSPGTYKSDAPAFAINSVPEVTSTASLLTLAGFGGLFARRFWARK